MCDLSGQCLRFRFRCHFCSVIIFVAVFTVVATGRIVKNYTVSLPTPASEAACMNLGVPIAAPVSWRFKNLHTYHMHTFRFPPNRLNYYLCVPAKNGNHNWAGLFYRLWLGSVPQSFEAVKNMMDSFSVRDDYSRSRDRIWLVTRNPYVKMLSIYKEKVECGADGCHHHYLEGFALFRNLGAISFETFLEVLVMRITQTKNCDAAVNYILNQYHNTPRENVTIPSAEIAPANEEHKVSKPFGMSKILRGSLLCQLDHHLCIQSAALFKLKDGRVRVLRLEEQGKWFKTFVECMGIDPASIVGEEWRGFSRQPCFYTPTGNCSDAMKVDEKVHLIKGGVHGNGAVDFMDDYYSPRAAHLVTFLYEFDLNILGYLPWNGSTPFRHQMESLLTF